MFHILLCFLQFYLYYSIGRSIRFELKSFMCPWVSSVLAIINLNPVYMSRDTCIKCSSGKFNTITATSKGHNKEASKLSLESDRSRFESKASSLLTLPPQASGLTCVKCLVQCSVLHGNCPLHIVCHFLLIKFIKHFVCHLQLLLADWGQV